MLHIILKQFSSKSKCFGLFTRLFSILKIQICETEVILALFFFVKACSSSKVKTNLGGTHLLYFPIAWEVNSQAIKN